MKFGIYCPWGYTEDSGGILACHKLADVLGRMLPERDVFIISSSKLAAYKGALVQLRSVDEKYLEFIGVVDNNRFAITKKDFVAIYPEVVTGNPLKADNVVRWVLNTTGVVGGDERTWGPKDISFLFSSAYNVTPAKQANCKGVMAVFEYHLDKFKNEHKERDISCSYVVRKGKDKREVWHNGESLNIDGYEELGGNTYLADIFNRSHVFLSYDHACFLSVQAALCGAMSVVVPDPNMSERDWHSKFEYFKYGIAYGCDLPQTIWALGTMDKVLPHMNDLNLRSLDQVSDFINICEKEFA